MKFWVISAVLTQVAAMLPVIFFLGGIYSTNTAALDSIRKLQTVLEQRGHVENGSMVSRGRHTAQTCCCVGGMRLPQVQHVFG